MDKGNPPKDSLSEIHPSRSEHHSNKKFNLGLVIGGTIGMAGLAITALTTPFILPALRKHCLPYVPATDLQLANLSKAFKKHARKEGTFLDIGSGDGRICRFSAQLKIFSEVYGVELNYILVLFSRTMAILSGQFGHTKFYHSDLWRFPLASYDNICIFGVGSMMNPLEKHLKATNKKQQIIFACRFPFENMTEIDTIGSGIDTVWVYKLREKSVAQKSS